MLANRFRVASISRCRVHVCVGLCANVSRFVPDRTYEATSVVWQNLLLFRAWFCVLSSIVVEVLTTYHSLDEILNWGLLLKSYGYELWTRTFDQVTDVTLILSLVYVSTMRENNVSLIIFYLPALGLYAGKTRSWNKATRTTTVCVFLCCW